MEFVTIKLHTLSLPNFSEAVDDKLVIWSVPVFTNLNSVIFSKSVVMSSVPFLNLNKNNLQKW